jgi:hypothetical protein
LTDATIEAVRPTHSPLRQTARKWLWALHPELFERFVRPHRGQTFSIGLYVGASPLDLVPMPQVRNPVLTCDDVTDVPAAFVADPCIVHDRGHWFMFFEVFSRVTRTGHIALATSADGRAWKYRRVVLAEPFHMAYPRVFLAGERYYMIPDTPTEGVLLYETDAFPGQWRVKQRLLIGGTFSDSTVFEHDGRWWMYTAWARAPGESKSLRLFMAPDLLGPWREHPASPVVAHDDRSARPAGRVLVHKGRVTRFAQDCSEVYGRAVHAYDVVKLTPTEYEERAAQRAPVLGPRGRGWAKGGMHHIDAHQLNDGSWLACVDGWYQRA